MKITLSAKTDIGKERDQNEDAFIICPDLSHPDWDKSEASVDLGPYGSLLVVADGMGGANAGEVASSLAMETLKRRFSPSNLATACSSDQQATDFLQASVKAADDAIREQILKQPETEGMGTTIVICWILKDKAYIAWCGDSRCYLFNPQTGLRALTKDHSYVQELIDKGELTEEAAFTHPDNNVITRGLGDFDESAVADIVIQPLQPTDTLLLCSDGLCGYCTNKTIEKVMKAHSGNVSNCCKALMDTALNAGGYDNICIALARVGTDNESESNTITSKATKFLQSLFKRKR
jgi:protein phosphatase